MLVVRGAFVMHAVPLSLTRSLQMAQALGHMVSTSISSTSEYVELEIKQALEVGRTTGDGLAID